MAESKVENIPEKARALLALNPKEESEFKQKVQAAKKNKSKSVGEDEPFNFIFSFKRRFYCHILL